MLKNVITVDVLMGMPRALVQNLREIRQKQLKARDEEAEQTVNGMSIPDLTDIIENEM